MILPFLGIDADIAFGQSTASPITSCVFFGGYVMNYVSIALAVSLVVAGNGVALAQSKCDSRFTKAAAKKAACKSNVISKAQAKGLAPDAEKLTKCETKFDESCAKAQEEADCAAHLGTCNAMEVTVDECVTAFSSSSAGPASACGDGAVSCPEVCDDGNEHPCGTCNAACTASVQPSAATGFILTPASSELADGETFTLDDGFGNVAVFEFETGGGTTFIPVSASLASASIMAQRIETAITLSSIGISASAGSNMVSLTNVRQSSLGNTPIQESVDSQDFVTNGMQGGAAGDCLTGIECSSDSDCASASCGTVVLGVCD
jgi:cysteine-rich repeat protein